MTSLDKREHRHIVDNFVDSFRYTYIGFPNLWRIENELKKSMTNLPNPYILHLFLTN